MTPDLADKDHEPVRDGWLYRCDDRSPFAYPRGSEFIRYADHARWAQLCDDRLLSMRSGACLAQRLGRVFYDAVSGRPLYYQPSSVALPAAPPARERSAVRASHSASPHRMANSLTATTPAGFRHDV